MSSIKVLIAEDDLKLRRTLVQLISLESDLSVVSDVGNGEKALAEAAILKPDVVLSDIDMPVKDGIALTRELRRLLPATQVVILTKFGDDENVFAALKAGALGYVLKDSGLEELSRGIRAAHAGEGVLSPSLVARVMAEFTRVSAGALHNRKLFAELSRREIEVLECISVGMRNAQIAEKLFLSEKTVKSHVGSILKKLEVNDRTEAALLAQQSGLLSPELDRD